MLSQQPSASIRRVVPMSMPLNERSLASDRAGQLLQIALALYLIPALLAVLAVESLGMLVLALRDRQPFARKRPSSDL
jgi:hypothetical protein